MYGFARSNSTARLNEVRHTLDVIKNLESPVGVGMSDSTQVQILRGLFFVHLYGAFEFSVNSCVQTALQEISTSKTPISNLEKRVYVLALDAQFTSNDETGSKSKWEKRINLVDKQFSSDECALNDSIMSNYLQNIWHKTLVVIYDCFSISKSTVLYPRHIGYINELVEKRNAVAHGRLSPVQAAAGMRSSDLEIRLTEITQAIAYLYDCFESYLLNREFVAPAHR